MPEKSVLSSMNESQREAVTHGEGPLLVLAGPGSGKTFTITQRILYLLQELHIPAEQILVITFTKAAALSMQNRFKAQSEQIYPVNFGTFHSCFYHILRESHVLQNYKIATQAQKQKIVSRLLASKSSGNLNEKQRETAETASQFLQAFSFYKNTYDESGAKNKLSMEHQESFRQMFQAYERERERKRLLDFDDMVYQCHKLLMKDIQLRTYWQSRFSHILMDEFQDINPMQYEVVKLLVGEKTQLFAVGDDDQSIYGFRGSQPVCLRQFQEDFKAKQVCLSVNYRSTPEIVQASLKVISENKQRFEKKLTSSQELNAKIGECASQVSLRAFEEREEQYTYLAQKLDSLTNHQDSAALKQSASELTVSDSSISDSSAETVSKNFSSESIGILFRTNAYMQGFAAKLSRMGIPYDMKEKVTSIYDHFIVKDIMAYLRLAEGVGGREQLLRILNKPLRYLSREALGYMPDFAVPSVKNANSVQGTVLSASQPDEIPKEVSDEISEEMPREIAENMLEFTLERMLECMFCYYRDAQDIAYRRERIDAIEKLKKDFSIMKSRSLYLKIQYILKGMGYEKHLKDNAGNDMEKWQEYQEILEWICTEAKECENLSKWMDMKELYEQSLKEMQVKGTDEKKSDEKIPEAQDEVQIHLMTVHASKGLEFDYVWIPDCNEKVFPHGNMPDAAACEEERRIFYVAMTRAKKSLELLYLIGTKERPRLPSRFLNPLFD